ncbi:hypothetical protein [Sphingobium sp.]|uniref:hypothetical protein n=1 Tax=Sphingobium sp. TaxID=1912891 RepID=UPI0035C664B1
MIVAGDLTVTNPASRTFSSMKIMTAPRATTAAGAKAGTTFQWEARQKRAPSDSAESEGALAIPVNAAAPVSAAAFRSFGQAAAA